MADLSDAASVTSVYELGAVNRVTTPAKFFRGTLLDSDGKCYGVVKDQFDQEWPLQQITERIPQFFTITEQNYDGRIKVRFNSYPLEATRIDFDWIPYPIDLKDNTSSKPLIPRQWSDVLIHGPAAKIWKRKNDDDNFGTHMGITRARLTAMNNSVNKDQARTNPNYGRVSPRPELGPRLDLRSRLSRGV